MKLVYQSLFLSAIECFSLHLSIFLTSQDNRCGHLRPITVWRSWLRGPSRPGLNEAKAWKLMSLWSAWPDKSNDMQCDVLKSCQEHRHYACLRISLLFQFSHPNKTISQQKQSGACWMRWIIFFFVSYFVGMLHENKIKSYRNRKMVFNDTERSFYRGPSTLQFWCFSVLYVGGNRRGVVSMPGYEEGPGQAGRGLITKINKT